MKPAHKKQSRRRSGAKTTIEPLEAKTPNQKDYIRTIVENDIIFCTGPSGSGKSFIPAGISAQHLHAQHVEQIVVSRPLVCAGKDIGSLPGFLDEKIAPYLLPMEENLKFFLGRAMYGHYFNGGNIQYRPLELMRGATFHNTYMILDEAQNCTRDQIKLFISRMGQNSKVMINGDVKQTDLHSRSGLFDSIDRCRPIDGVGISELTYEDIQRNGILGEVLRALED